MKKNEKEHKYWFAQPSFELFLDIKKKNKYWFNQPPVETNKKTKNEILVQSAVLWKQENIKYEKYWFNQPPLNNKIKNRKNEQIPVQ